MAIDPKLLAHFAELRDDYPMFAENVLRIKDKLGRNVPFIFNSAQWMLHEMIEKQKAKTGKVRVLIDKGRQQGISTYIGGRFYHNSTTQRGRNTYILSHKIDTSDALFDMVERFQEHNPFAPITGKDNAKELEFKKLDSSYYVDTAGAKAGGRGKTSLNFHGSEVAFWDSAPLHFASSVQTVPDMEGTEIALESTANGVTGEYYERWQDAIAGIGDYLACFIPWYLQDEYRRKVPEDFELIADNTLPGVRGESLFSEVEYMQLFNLTLEQMVWRRAKAQELKSIALFDQEYPATSELSFQQKAEGAYHQVGPIIRARKRKNVTAAGPLILGVDPAGEGGDRFAIAFRRGYVCEQIIWRDKVSHSEAVEWLKTVIDENDPAVVFIDAGGIGKAIISDLRLKGERYNPPHVRPVNFGAKSQHKMAKPLVPGPINRRAEMQERVKDWLDLPEGVSIPDLDVLQADLIETKIKKHAANDLQLESKQEIRARGARSPDLADALGLTFADLTYIKSFTKPPKKPSFAQIDSENIIQPTRREVNEYGGGGFDSWDGGGDSWMG